MNGVMQTTQAIDGINTATEKQRLSAQEVETLITELHKANLTSYSQTLDKGSIGQPA
ncbi:hypothetical protein APX70_200551 [Pseudomonas syringae pv. maculicola]|uniref:Uncharacterized protein n=1 Tax=Pseudomonas syringae pv. maculicola TaxID=59511 RepID=A0A3M2W8M9_PSEYM|nr:hypothetical protein APX70_200551 [Pseudomonas syringae pv. maculicola]